MVWKFTKFCFGETWKIYFSKNVSTLLCCAVSLIDSNWPSAQSDFFLLFFPFFNSLKNVENKQQFIIRHQKLEIFHYSKQNLNVQNGCCYICVITLFLNSGTCYPFVILQILLLFKCKMNQNAI